MNRKISVSAAALAASTLASTAWGRAGGGHSYSSSPSHSSSSHSSYSHSTTAYPSHSSSYYPSGASSGGDSSGALIFIMIVVLIIWLLFRLFRKDVADSVEIPDNNLAVDRLRTYDGAFDEAAFTARVTTAFLGIQNAWSNSDMEPVRPFMSDGVFERLSLGLAQLKSDGQSNRLENPVVQSIRVIDFAPAGRFGVLHVAIHAQGNDVTTDARGHVLESSAASFTEIWTFIRKLSAVSAAGKPGLIERFCPSCGAPLTTTDPVRCASCHCVIKSGDHDWVLSEITQASEVQADASARIMEMADAAGILQADPDFCGQAVEDTATVMFIRCLRARNERNVDYVRKCSSTEYAADLQKILANHPSREDKAAIGSVGVQRIWTRPEDAMVYCDVEVVWSSQRAANTEPVNRHSILRMARHRTTPSNLGVGVTRCRNCSAPDDGKASNSCVYCGAVYNDPKQDWLLVSESIDLNGER